MANQDRSRLAGRYRYIVADLRTGQVHAELPLRDVTFSSVLNDAGEFQGQLMLGDPRIAVHEPEFLTRPAHTALYVERDGVVVWGGIIWTSKYSSASRAIEIGAAGFLSYFDHRRVLPSDFDPSKGNLADITVTYTDVDQTEIARSLIATAQGHPRGDIRIQSDPYATSQIRRTITYPGRELKSVGDALRELSNLENGPDFVFDVIYGGEGRHLVHRLRVGTPELGQQGTPHVWEFGGNLIEYAWPRDGSSMATRVFALGDENEEGQQVGIAQDNSTARPLLETEVSLVNMSDVQLLQSHARSALAAAVDPVVLPELIVRGDRDPMLGSYSVGDHALIVVRDDFFPFGTQFRVRIVALEVTPGDDAGEEKVQLTVSPISGGQS
ncbi:hypothetical protein LWC34_02905 [Kibdelosporangium philippinense]|uniref:Virus ReqiPepy6 Gp37-like protein n=1 Tax=Kibdelosporangium philippinense TaxID=211113 RepID=A0ABS8Z4C5_9PSEU|nr:hypothetical protein [Kibdelosporangium philippinense]MCE7001794.1 hypothetical protein [Kibdelosporangium philippinense]